MTYPYEDTLYAQLGPEIFEKLVHEFYVRMPHDDLIGPMYPEDDWEGAEDRLRWFLVQYWGGPATFSSHRGHPPLRMRHARFPIDVTAAQRWLDLMEAAMETFDTTELPEAARAQLREHMQRVAFMLINHS